MTACNALTGRSFLWSAWVAPAFLAITSAPSIAVATEAAVLAAAIAGLFACLPNGYWKVACALTVLALPFTSWWCAVAAIGGTGPGYEAAIAATETNWREFIDASAYITSYLSFYLAIAIHGFCLALACRCALRRGDIHLGTGAERHFVSAALLASLSVLALLALLSMQDFYDRRGFFFGRATLNSPLGSAAEIFVEKVRLTLWYREQGYRRKTAHATTHVSRPILAVFLLGESARADGYGPHQARRGDDSKKLAQRIDDGLGSWLPTTCASSDGTHMSVPLLLTATSPEHIEDAPLAPTILGILKADGFSTAWLANNYAGQDARESGHDFYAGNFRINPDESDSQERQSWTFDNEMLPYAKVFATSHSGPKAMILHLIGSHINYESRYPAEAFASEPAALNKGEQTELRYSRSLEYEAHTILGVAEILDSTIEPAFLVYTSDHGETLPSDHSGFLLHLGPRTNQADGTVPTFVLWNRAMADTGIPTRALSQLVNAAQIAHVDVAKLFLAMAGAVPIPVVPTAKPTIWGRISVGDPYSAIACAELKP